MINPKMNVLTYAYKRITFFTYFCTLMFLYLATLFILDIFMALNEMKEKWGMQVKGLNRETEKVCVCVRERERQRERETEREDSE
jgi:hypothetical protein